MECQVGKPATFSGWASDYDRAIVAVEFSLDDEDTWVRYPTPKTTSDRWVKWNFAFVPRVRGEYLLKVRSVNEKGETSPTVASVQFSAVA